jgi:hypothetical protein
MKRYFLGLPIFEALFAITIAAGVLAALFTAAIVWFRT